MKFSISSALEILERTPDVLDSLLRDVSEDWTHVNEGGDSWSAFDIVGHLVHGEKTDWIDRMNITLSKGSEKLFKPFDRFAQFTDSKGKTLNQLLDEFKELRLKNMDILKNKNLANDDLQSTGIHPVFGEVTLSQLLSTWVVHDLSHIAQITRVMGKQYKDEVGPWIKNLKILNT